MCDMNAIVSETLHTLKKHKMLPRSLDVSFTPDGALPACQADPEQMKLVLWNIILNAAQAVESQPSPDVRIHVFHRPIDGKDHLIVDIRDNGPAFDASRAHMFFEPFYGNREGGVGLGLTLSRRAIERHGGRIGIERKNDFTRVSFAFPTTGGVDNRNPSAFSRAMN